ncbi:MAG: CBS domain-containing protein [Pseudomonadales bacterium]
MRQITVQELMAPTESYATISEYGTLRDAVLALQEAQRRERKSNPNLYRDRAVLVIEKGRIIGKLNMLDEIRGLEPRYDRFEGTRSSSVGAARVGSARFLVESMAKNFGLWQKPLSRLVQKASNIYVRDLVRPYDETETVELTATMDTAVHQFIVGQYQSLLVKSAGKLVGILRLSDVYERFSEMIIACQPEQSEEQ